jgi:hypothetical protein
MNTKVYDLFKQLELPRCAASTYCALLSSGPLKMDDLVREARERRDDVTNAVAVLRTMRLVGNDRGNFYAADPGVAWLAIIADQVWTEKATLAPLTALPQLGDKEAERKRRVSEELGRVASEMYRPHLAAKNHRVLEAETWDQLSFLTCEIILRAKEQIVAVSKSPRSPQLSHFWAVLTDRLDHHGVRYSRVADLDEVEAHGLKIVTRDMDDHQIDLRILERAKISHEFYAVDEKLLTVSHQPGSVRTQRGLGVGRFTNYLDVVRRYWERFHQYAAESIPARFVVAMLQAASEGLVLRARTSLPPYMVSWLQDIIDYGKFSRFDFMERWSPDKLAAAERTATEQGFVRRNPYNELVPTYGITECDLRAAYATRMSEV